MALIAWISALDSPAPHVLICDPQSEFSGPGRKVNSNLARQGDGLRVMDPRAGKDGRCLRPRRPVRSHRMTHRQSLFPYDFSHD